MVKFHVDSCGESYSNMYLGGTGYGTESETGETGDFPLHFFPLPRGPTMFRSVHANRQGWSVHAITGVNRL